MTSLILDNVRPVGERSETWSDIIVDAIEGRLADLHTGLPARVIAFDEAKGSCQVQVLLNRVFVNEDDSSSIIAIPPIDNVPIIYEGGAGWSITYPLAPGDIVFLAFAERSIDDWLETEPGQLVTPTQVRKHDLSDAIALPSLHTRRSPIANISTTNLRIQHDNGLVAIDLSPEDAHVRAPKVYIDAGGDADQAIPRGDELVQALAQLKVLTAFGPSSVPVNAADILKAVSAAAKVR